MAGTASAGRWPRRFAAEGARVTVADVDTGRARKIAERIGGLAVTCDVGDRTAVADLVGRATTAHGPVDVFCSNAGILDRAPGLTPTREQVEEITRVNLLAHVWAAQEVLPSMVERGGGHLVSTISSAGLIAGPADMGYTFTKHGALGLAEWIAVNYAHLGRQGDVPVPERRQHRHDRARRGRRGAGWRGCRRRARAVSATSSSPRSVRRWCSMRCASGRFLVLPHPRVGDSFARKGADYDDWIAGTNRRLRRMHGEAV